MSISFLVLELSYLVLIILELSYLVLIILELSYLVLIILELSCNCFCYVIFSCNMTESTRCLLSLVVIPTCMYMYYSITGSYLHLYAHIL